MWRWFWELSETRRFDRIVEPGWEEGKGSYQTIKKYARRLSFAEVESWSRLVGVRLEQWHLAAVGLIDEYYVKSFNESVVTPKKAMGRKLSVRLFDALFGSR